MVRIKQRYLLFNILYPYPPTSGPPSKATDTPHPPAQILFSRPSPAHLTPGVLLTAIRASIHTLFGDHGLSVTQSSLRMIYFSPTTSTGILRVPRAHFRIVWAGLSFLTEIPKERGGGRMGRGGGGGSGGGAEEVPCVISVVRVSGTIKKSEEELLKRARREVVRAKMEGRDGEREEVLGIFASEKGGAQKKRLTPTILMAGDEEGIMDLDDEEDEDLDDLSD